MGRISEAGSVCGESGAAAANLRAARPLETRLLLMREGSKEAAARLRRPEETGRGRRTAVGRLVPGAPARLPPWEAENPTERETVAKIGKPEVVRMVGW